MDIDNGLFVMGVDGLEGSALYTGDEFIVDEAVVVSKAYRASVNETYSPIGCS